MRECSDILRVMTCGSIERLIRREGSSGDEAAGAPSALLRALGFEKVTVVFEWLPAT
jgi:hypothetical protein